MNLFKISIPHWFYSNKMNKEAFRQKRGDFNTTLVLFKLFNVFVCCIPGKISIPHWFYSNNEFNSNFSETID